MVRSDLSPPQQAVQACHAVAELARRGHFPSDGEHPHLVLCSVPDVRSLTAAADRLRARIPDVPLAVWHEPDLNDEPTALAVRPVSGPARRHFSRYPLCTLSQKETP